MKKPGFAGIPDKNRPAEFMPQSRFGQPAGPSKDLFKNYPDIPRLGERFYAGDPISVARRLLGQRLVRVVNGNRLAGIIVETEAYLGIEDRASHSFAGRHTPRNSAMYQRGGTTYVFLNYGIHHLVNVVTEKTGQPSAVLIRALEPSEGIDAMFQRRPQAQTIRDLCSGPGKLTEALMIDLACNGSDLVSSPELFIEQIRKRRLPENSIQTSSRIGIAYAAEWADKPLRFFIKNNPHVSRG